MAAISVLHKNIIDVSTAMHRGKVLPEVKLLAQQNQALMDMPWRVCNDGTTHLYSLQTALPTVQKTSFGEGTKPSKSQSAKERAHCAMISGFSSVPRDTIKAGGQMGPLRAAEDVNFAESMKQQFGKSILYDNRDASLLDIYGFLTLYNKLSGAKANSTISCGGATANAQMSILLVNWGADVYGIFPEGFTAGLDKEDLGPQVVTLPNGNRLVMMETKHDWHFGLVVECHPSVVRICNIEVSHALALSNNQAPTSFNTVIDKFIAAANRLSRRPGKVVAYVNDVGYELFMRLGLHMEGGPVKVEEKITQFGAFTELKLLGTPIRRQDQLLRTEQVVAA